MVRIPKASPAYFDPYEFIFCQLSDTSFMFKCSLPPSVNGARHKNRSRKQYVKDWQEDLQKALRIVDAPFFSGLVFMKVDFVFKTWASDVNNRLKFLEDAMNNIVWTDDKELITSATDKYTTKKGVLPYCVVTVQQLQEQRKDRQRGAFVPPEGVIVKTL